MTNFPRKTSTSLLFSAVLQDVCCTMNDRSLIRVFGSKLDTKKPWYALNSSICGGKPSRFVKSKFFDLYSGEISRVKSQELWREDGQFVPAKVFGERNNTSDVFVITSFGLFGGLVASCKGNIDSPLVRTCMDILNSTDLTKTVSSPCELINVTTPIAKRPTATNNQATPKTNRIRLLEKELQHYKCKTRDVEAALREANTPPSTPAESVSESMDAIDEDSLHSPNLSDMLSSDLGPISKKRSVNALCKRAWQSLSDCCNLYDTNMGQLLGNAHIYGDISLQNDVVSVIRETLDIMVDKKGYRHTLNLVSSTSIENKKNMEIRVPDWVQVYVKLCTKMPDTSWQTLINYLNIGRTGVSKINLKN